MCFQLDQEIRKPVSDLNRGRKGQVPYLRIAALAFIALGLSAITLRPYFYPSLAEGLDALTAAFHEQRPLETRISDFNYAPKPDKRGGTAKVDYAQRDRAASILLQVVKNASAGSYHALGKYFLAEHKFDEAIDQFEQSLKFDPQNGRVHNDLGVALLERGKVRGSKLEHGEETADFAKSLEQFNKALELDNNLLEALFNRALLYRQMGLSGQSNNDWREYLGKDPNSKWADEARQQQSEIEKQLAEASSDEDRFLQDFLAAYKRGDQGSAWDLIRQSYSSAGNTIANTLLDSYLDNDREGKSADADSELKALSYLGQLEFQNTGDTYTSDLVRFYSRSDFRQRRALTRARWHMKKAYELFLRSDVNEALTYYSRAKQAFSESGSESEALFATYRMGHCYLHQPNLKKSEEIFARLRSVSERNNYKWLLNQSIFRTASIRFTLNEFSRAIDYAQQALKQAEQLGDTVGTLNALILLSDQYRSLNDQRQSWIYLHHALTLTSEKGAEPLQSWGIFTSIALNLNTLGHHQAAIEYQKEALKVALEMKPDRPLIVSRSYDYLALTYASLNNYDSALMNVNLAFEAGKQLTDQHSKQEIMANSSLHAGDIYRQAKDYNKAIESYDRSIRLYEQLEYPHFTYPARKGKLLAFVANGDDSATEAELRSVLAIFDQYRSKLMRESQRNSFFDVEQSVYDLAIDFALSRKQDPLLAFDYSEQSRARSLRDAMHQSQQVAEDKIELSLAAISNPRSLSDIQHRLPAQAQIVQYAVLEDKLLIWVVSQTNVTPREVPLSSLALGEKVSEYLQAVKRPGMDAGLEKAAKELHKLLITPIEPLLDKTKLVCIVPDKILHFLPFDALISETTGRYLVEDLLLEVSPSSSIFIDCSIAASRKAGRGNERLLSVGDPSFDPKAFPTLQRLASARREAETVAAYYSSTFRPLLGKDATELRIRSEILKSNVAHFAIHYEANERFSLFSGMVLASPPGVKVSDKEDDGVWQIHEIYKMKLPQMRLVVLSACQTGVEHQYGGEGAVSVARPFIAAGVPLVVATLWPVDSEASEKLMVSFHRYRRLGGGLLTVEALRRAQLDLLRGEDSRYHHPYYWAAFTAIGGYAEY